MENAFNYRILVAEELCVINFEIKLLLRKQGFHVIETSGLTNFIDIIKNQAPDFIITCQANLKKIADKENNLRTLLVSNENRMTDTIILDNKMNTLMRYSKPYNAKDMINYIIQHLNIN
jgi:hypothetical protein